MNVFRLAGDMTHLLSVVVLLLKIHTIKSCAGTPFSSSLRSTGIRARNLKRIALPVPFLRILVIGSSGTAPEISISRGAGGCGGVRNAAFALRASR